MELVDLGHEFFDGGSLGFGLDFESCDLLFETLVLFFKLGQFLNQLLGRVRVKLVGGSLGVGPENTELVLELDDSAVV